MKSFSHYSSVEHHHQLRTTVTHIIHSAWHLDFNMILSSFEATHIAGVRHLADLALASPKATCPRIIFISSINAYGSWQPGAGIPEACVDFPPPVASGYGQVCFLLTLL